MAVTAEPSDATISEAPEQARVPRTLVGAQVLSGPGEDPGCGRPVRRDAGASGGLGAGATVAATSYPTLSAIEAIASLAMVPVVALTARLRTAHGHERAGQVSRAS